MSFFIFLLAKISGGCVVGVLARNNSMGRKKQSSPCTDPSYKPPRRDDDDDEVELSASDDSSSSSDYCEYNVDADDADLLLGSSDIISDEEEELPGGELCIEGEGNWVNAGDEARRLQVCINSLFKKKERHCTLYWRYTALHQSIYTHTHTHTTPNITAIHTLRERSCCFLLPLSSFYFIWLLTFIVPFIVEMKARVKDSERGQQGT